MEDKLKNYWLEKTMRIFFEDNSKISELFSTLLVSEVLIPTEFYLGGREFTKENLVIAYKRNEVQVSYLLSDIEQNGEKRIVMFSSNGRSNLPLPKPYNLIKFNFKEFLLYEYDSENIKGIIINPYHEAIILNNNHINIMLSALLEKNN